MLIINSNKINVLISIYNNTYISFFFLTSSASFFLDCFQNCNSLFKESTFGFINFLHMCLFPMPLHFALIFLISFHLHFQLNFLGFLLPSYAFKDRKIPQSTAVAAGHQFKCHTFFLIQLKYILVPCGFFFFTVDYLEVHCLIFRHLGIFQFLFYYDYQTFYGWSQNITLIAVL